ncbi:MAG: hypothetical protein ACXVLQ_17745 [Bacteriovorax sp.]
MNPFKFKKIQSFLMILPYFIFNSAHADNPCRDKTIHTESREVCKLENGNSVQLLFTHQCFQVLKNTEKKVLLKNASGQVLNEVQLPSELSSHVSFISPSNGICKGNEYIGVFDFSKGVQFNGGAAFEKNFLVVGVNQNEQLSVAIEKSHPFPYPLKTLDDQELYFRVEAKTLTSNNRVFTTSISENDPKNSVLKFWNSDAKVEKQMDHCFRPHLRNANTLDCFDGYSDSPNQDNRQLTGLSSIDVDTLLRKTIVDNSYRWLDLFHIFSDGSKSYATVSSDLDREYHPYVLVFNYETDHQFTIPLFERAGQASMTKFKLMASLDYMSGPVSEGFKIVNYTRDGNYSRCLLEGKNIVEGTKLYLATTVHETNADIDPVHKCWLSPAGL